jgi:hypothetical protein
VPSFENTPETWERVDWQLLQNGFVTMFWSRDLFTATAHSLTDMGYKVVALDAGEWHTTQDALLSLGEALDFPSYYGKNLDALVDCLRDVAGFDYGSDPESEGTVIALDHYDKFTTLLSQMAWTILDILADTGRQALLIGHRFIVILQSDHDGLTFGTVGGTSVGWNRREFLNKKRGQ